MQTIEVLMRMARFTTITSELAVIADGPDYCPASERSPITAQVVIGTSGCIIDLIRSKKLCMSFMKILVFDDLDHGLAPAVVYFF